MLHFSAVLSHFFGFEAALCDVDVLACTMLKNICNVLSIYKEKKIESPYSTSYGNSTTPSKASNKISDFNKQICN